MDVEAKLSDEKKENTAAVPLPDLSSLFFFVPPSELFLSSPAEPRQCIPN